MERDRMEKNGMEWNGVKWNRMEWNRMKWDRAEFGFIIYSVKADTEGNTEKIYRYEFRRIEVKHIVS